MRGNLQARFGGGPTEKDHKRGTSLAAYPTLKASGESEGSSLSQHLVEPSFDHSTFSKNRARLLRHRVSREFFDAVVLQTDQRGLLSDEHFSVDGTLIKAAASLKSFRPKDEPPPPKRPDGGNPSNRWVSFHGQKRSNATHQSTTDPDARRVAKVQARKLASATWARR